MIFRGGELGTVELKYFISSNVFYYEYKLPAACAITGYSSQPGWVNDETYSYAYFGLLFANTAIDKVIIKHVERYIGIYIYIYIYI